MSTLELPVSASARFILAKLEAAGFAAYIVGGAVRDLLRQQKKAASAELRTDYDFATNAKPEEILKLFDGAFYENEFGTVMVSAEHIAEMMGIKNHLHANATQQTLQAGESKEKVIDVAQATKVHASLQTDSPVSNIQYPISNPNFEITTFRSKEIYSDFRKPNTLEWGKTIQEDLKRRDFTINAMALRPVAERWEVIDPFRGQLDLAAGLIRAVGDPHLRFQEDALRMLRAIRFSVQLNLQVDGETFAAIVAHAHLLRHISAERIRDEFLKMLASNFPAEAVEILDETGLLHYILPELLTAKGVEQGGHHTTDVWTHSLDALRYCPSSDPIVRLATLLHDIAKPQTQAVGKTGDITFYNHEVVGARVAKQIAQRLRLSKTEQDKTFILVRYHMFYYQPQMTDAAIRRFMRKVGLAHIDDILDVREGDRLGSGARKTSWRLEEMKERMIAQLNQPMEVTDLAINGNDLMQEFGLKPGPILGKTLNALLELVFEQPELNTKESLFAEAKKLLTISPTLPAAVNDR